MASARGIALMLTSLGDHEVLQSMESVDPTVQRRRSCQLAVMAFVKLDRHTWIQLVYVVRHPSAIQVDVLIDDRS